MPSSPEKERILVVDDSPETLEVLQRNLAAEGYQVFTSTGVVEAIRLLEGTQVDLVITDLKMPKVSGLDLVRHVRENFNDIEIMMITGYPSIGSAVEAIKTGAEEYLAKPFTDEELLSAVRRALDKQHMHRQTFTDQAAAADAHFNARIGQVQKDILAPQLTAIHTANAQTSRALAAQSHSDAFSRWGPEIDMQMSGIAVEQRTFEMYSEAVKLVKGAHATEITRESLDAAVRDEIERRTAAGTIRSGDAPTGAATAESLDFNSESLSDRWANIAEDTTLEGRIAFLQKAYPDLTLAEAKAKYLKLVNKGNAVSAEANA